MASGHAVWPSEWPRIAPTTAEQVCVTKPSNDDAAPARSGNGSNAPACACASVMPMPISVERRSRDDQPQAPSGVNASSTTIVRPPSAMAAAPKPIVRPLPQRMTKRAAIEVPTM